MRSDPDGYAFHDSLIPALPAGRYTITTTHELVGVATGDYFEAPDVRHLAVVAPRFALPVHSVHAVYPAGGSVGRFDRVLPHIALERPPLPWERRLAGAAPSVPWLALLVFTTGELPGDPEAIGLTVDRHVGDLLASTDAVPPNIARADVTDLQETCATVDIPAALFAKVAPRLDELTQLVHVRKGDGEASLTVRSARTRGRSRRGVIRAPVRRGLGDGDDPSLHPDLHSVVIANRFPRATGGQYVAHLVSLDGFAAYVGPTPPPPDKPLRMVSLHSWSFRSLADAGARFAEVMSTLAKPGTDDPAVLTLRLPPGQATGEAQARLAQGYTPVDFGLGSGEHTYAWYRGPLTPVAAQPVPAPATVATTPTADAWLVYLEQYGLFDVSYAAAWTIGRALALADADFAASLIGWRQAARQMAGRLVRGHGRVGQPLHGARLAFADLDAASLLTARPAFAQFEDLLARGIGDGTAPPARPRRPASPVKHKPAAALRNHLADDEVRGRLRDALAEQANPVLDWLDRLALLYPVPFDHIIPHPALLPNESLRFCYLDRGWQTALLYGALSIGVASSLDAELTTLLHDALEQTPTPITGFVVRSALVPEWPALRFHVHGTPPGGGTDELEVLRADALGPDVALVLVEGALDKIEVAEPPQALHFGYDDLITDQGRTPGIVLRDLSKGNIGKELPNKRLIDFEAQYLRHADAAQAALRVLDVGSLTSGIATALGAAVTPAALAIELVRSAQHITFARTAAQ